jgi:hypothetical protein
MLQRESFKIAGFYQSNGGGPDRSKDRKGGLRENMVDFIRKNLRRKAGAEKGNITLLFAATLVLLIFFIGVSLDLGMIYMERNELIDLCQVIREDRFTYQDTIRFAENPGLTSYRIISDTMADNGFDGTVKVYFSEREPESNYRYYRIRTKLSVKYSYSFLRLFGLNSATVSAFVDGGETYGEGINDVVWYPQMPVSRYNGSYTGTGAGGYGGYVYDASDLPADW